MNAATMQLLADKGLSMADIIEVAQSLEKKADPTNAARQARHRARRRSNAVTVTGVSPNDIYSNPVSSDEETTPKASKPKLIAKPETATDEVWADFQAMRSKQRATITKTAMAGIEREAAKAGMTVGAALAECVERNWRGFKAEWLTNGTTPRAGAPPANDFLAHLTGQQRQRDQFKQQQVRQ